MQAVHAVRGFAICGVFCLALLPLWLQRTGTCQGSAGLLLRAARAVCIGASRYLPGGCFSPAAAIALRSDWGQHPALSGCETMIVKATDSVPNAHSSSAHLLAIAATCAATYATGPCHAMGRGPGPTAQRRMFSAAETSRS
ncbi:hypothetical protein HaLaN_04680 [Haematococcus lacustris]|uniref:Uncharacterized protein n=1 Tax=Haematococcus lacustris TaxID=44745 RepID=A0A699YJ60_HAELA|nr:hypothetical protein HaLaN_04680 [Haematococcus lacustris]